MGIVNPKKPPGMCQCLCPCTSPLDTYWAMATFPDTQVKNRTVCRSCFAELNAEDRGLTEPWDLLFG